MSVTEMLSYCKEKNATKTNGRAKMTDIWNIRDIQGVHLILCFSLKFSELCQFCCSAGVLPAWCVYTH